MMRTCIHIISLGAGVQSTVLYLMAALGELEPMPAAAIFADTQWEPAHVYKHLDWLQSLETDIPIVRVSAGDLYQNTWDGARVKTGRKYPFTDIPAFTKHDDGSRGMGPRQCTERYKIEPVRQKTREISVGALALAAPDRLLSFSGWGSVPMNGCGAKILGRDGPQMPTR